jgi:hypothetical protein
MTYLIMAVLVVAIDLYSWVLRPTAARAVDALSVGIPVLILAAVFTRPRKEWPAIVVLAVSYALLLNRVLIPSQPIAYGCVLGGSIIVAILGYRLSAFDDTSKRRLGVATAAVLAAFAVFWLWGSFRS